MKFLILITGEYQLNQNNMDTLNLIITTSVCIVAIALFVLLVQFFSKKINYVDEINLKTAFAVWISFLTLSFAIMLSSCLKTISDTIEVLQGISNSDITLQIIEKVALYIGFTFIWFVIIYFITQFIMKILLGKRNDNIEIDRNNYSYYIIKGVFFLTLAFCLLPMFENFLRLFSPIVSTPFYR